MSDLVSRLLSAIEAKEAKARRADESEWYSVHVSDADVEAFWEDSKPAAVLRRCAADRKIVGIHARLGDLKDPDDLTYPEAADTCFTCGPGDHYSAQENPGWYPFPCSTLRTLASGYGVSVDEETPG